MNKSSVVALLNGFQKGVKKHTPEILTGLGIAGTVTAVVMAVKATPKAVALIEEEKKAQNVEKLSPVDTVKATYKCYIPTAITTTVSIACMVGASSVNLKRNAALAAAYTISESTLKEYKEKVIETVGEKKEQSIRDEIAKDKVEKDPVSAREVIVTGRGNTLCYDAAFGRYFECDIDAIKRAESSLNKRLRSEMYISLNDFYYEIGLQPIGVGDDVGWNIDNGYLDIAFSSQLAADGRPCLVISYEVGPRYDFAKNW